MDVKHDFFRRELYNARMVHEFVNVIYRMIKIVLQ